MQALGPLNRARAALGKKADAKRGVEEGIALGKQFGELGLALQGAAGVAMHLGAGEQALTLAEQVIERNRETGTNQDEAHVLLALAQCQLGRVEDAMVAIERVSPDDFPFGLAARALVRAVAGDLAGALVDADAVEATHGASYFDLALARLAGVLAAGRAGDEARSRRLARPARRPRVLRRRRRVRGHRPDPRGSPRTRRGGRGDRRVLGARLGLAPHRRLRRRRLAPILTASAGRVRHSPRRRPIAIWPRSHARSHGHRVRGDGRCCVASTGVSTVAPSRRARRASERSEFARQPALDGVRALAVALVLLFHQGWLSGGYVGVSVFFTLSGYLITSLALVEHDRTGRLDVRAFYGRRIKRLLPASLVCLVGVVVLAFTGVFDAVEHLRRDLWGALLQVYNWVSLSGDLSYAELVGGDEATRSPLDHYWSLAIEEQFYWVWPLVLVVVLRHSPRGRTAWIAAGTLVFAVAAPLIAGRLGWRRGVLGDAGAPRRDPRRCAAGDGAATRGGARPWRRPPVSSCPPASA